jgi:hypothetical protein
MREGTVELLPILVRHSVSTSPVSPHTDLSGAFSMSHFLSVHRMMRLCVVEGRDSASSFPVLPLQVPMPHNLTLPELSLCIRHHPFD